MTTKLKKTIDEYSSSTLLDDVNLEVVEGVNSYVNSAACLFPVAARNMIADGIAPKIVARLMMEAAYEALYPTSERVNPQIEKEAGATLLSLALEFQTAEHNSKPA